MADRMEALGMKAVGMARARARRMRSVWVVALPRTELGAVIWAV